MVFIAVPLGAMRDTFAAIRGICATMRCSPTGAASKGSVVADAEARSAGCPHAGTRTSHCRHRAQRRRCLLPELYRNRRVILTPLPETDPDAVERVTRMWRTCGARVTSMAVAHHDEILAATSHLPHMLAFGLVDALARMRENDEIFRYAAGGFRDFTRIASSNPVMWRDICIANREALGQVLRNFSDEMADLADTIRRTDGRSPAGGIRARQGRAGPLRRRYWYSGRARDGSRVAVMDSTSTYPASFCQTVADSLDVAIYVADLRTSEVLFVNRYARERWGAEYREKCCAAYLRSVSEDACPLCSSNRILDPAGNPTGVYRREFEDPETQEWFDCRDEAVTWPDGRLVHLEIAVNITERKRSERELKSSERFNKSIIQSSCDCIKVLDLEGRLQYMNESGRELLHITDIEPYLNQSYDEFWEGSDKAASRAAISTALQGEEGRFMGFAPTKDGAPKWWDVIVAPVFGEGKVVAQLLVVSRDITQRKIAEDALEDSERLLRQAQAYANIGYWSLDADLKTIAWSEEIYRLFGLDPDVVPSFDVLGRILHPDDAPLVIASLSECMRECREHNIEYRIVRPGEPLRWVACKGAPVLDSVDA